jgi:CO/xanthine dehydrogenase Mo-binding subunit
MAQIAGDVLNIPAERVKVIHPDTDVTPYDMATLGSRSTFHMGHAVRLAAEDAAGKLKLLREEMQLAADAPVKDVLKKHYGMQAGTIVGVGSFMPEYKSPDHETGRSENITPNWMVGATGAEVEVDTETGHVRVTRLENVVDCGTPINPGIVETQLSGAAIMQLGMSLYERMDFDPQGQLRNASFAEYKIPGTRDIPARIGNETVESRQSNGPFGAKGVGESVTFGVSPAIANAIDDAVGVRLTSLPLTPEAVYRALRTAKNKPLPKD